MTAKEDEMLRLKQLQAVMRMEDALSKYIDPREERHDFDVAPARPDPVPDNSHFSAKEKLKEQARMVLKAAETDPDIAALLNLPQMDIEDFESDDIEPKIIVDSVGVGFSYAGGGMIKVHYPTVDREKGTRHYGGGGLSFAVSELPDSYFSSNPPNAITAERMKIFKNLSEGLND